MSDEFAEIRRLVEAATAGPWALWDGSSWRRFGSDATGLTVCEPVTYSERDRHPDLYFRNGGPGGPDAAFLAECRTAVPALLAALDEARRERDEQMRIAGAAVLRGVEQMRRAEAAESALAAQAKVVEAAREYREAVVEADGYVLDRDVVGAREALDAALAALALGAGGEG